MQHLSPTGSSFDRDLAFRAGLGGDDRPVCECCGRNVDAVSTDAATGLDLCQLCIDDDVLTSAAVRAL